MPERLFHEVALLHSRRADVPLEQFAGRAGDDRRDLRFSLHVQSIIFYISVEAGSIGLPADTQLNKLSDDVRRGAGCRRRLLGSEPSTSHLLVRAPSFESRNGAQRAPSARPGFSMPFRECAQTSWALVAKRTPDFGRIRRRGRSEQPSPAIGTLVGVGSRMTVLGPRLGTLEPTTTCALWAHVVLRQWAVKYFAWDHAKNAKLRADRGIGFEEDRLPH
jgi:hypothetical protein